MPLEELALWTLAAAVLLQALWIAALWGRTEALARALLQMQRRDPSFRALEEQAKLNGWVSSKSRHI